MKRTPLKRKTPLRAKRANWHTTRTLARNGAGIAKAGKGTAKGQNTRNKRKPTPDLTAAKLKKELDRVFSLYIRAKYPKVCYTCGKPAERLQNGHYISRQYLATRWDEHNCRPQCWGCNGYGKGQPLVFEERLKSEYGDKFVEDMKAKRHQILKLDRNWYQQEIHRYTELLKNYTYGNIEV